MFLLPKDIADWSNNLFNFIELLTASIFFNCSSWISPSHCLHNFLNTHFKTVLITYVHAESIGEEQRTSTNSSVTNYATKLNPKGHLVADMHKSERKARCWTTHTTGTWNMRSRNQGKLETVMPKKMEHINISMLGVSELKWTGKGCTQLRSVHMNISRWLIQTLKRLSLQAGDEEAVFSLPKPKQERIVVLIMDC